VLIHEFLADPAPSVGLPSSSFIELRNVSRHTVNLRNWKISNAQTLASVKKDFLLGPDSLLIICATSAESDYRPYGSVLGLTGFPSLNHEAGEIILSSENGLVIHAVHYDKSWYRNELKSEGGWSLEMIDAKNPCGGSSNWTASEESGGGTPGKPNTAAVDNPDLQGPDLVSTQVPDALHILVLFSEPVDSLSAATPSNYTFSPDAGQPAEAVPLPPFYDQVAITLQQPLLPQQVYRLSVREVTDCMGNTISSYNTGKSGLPEPPAAGDLLFNEVLFNPAPYGFDYVELYNASQKVINLNHVFLAGRDILGTVKDPKRLVEASFLFFPGEYAVLTENTDWVKQNYQIGHPENLIAISAMPSMPDDHGTILIMDEAGMALDELSYDHHWHSPLLANEEGVSLERMRPDRPTNSASNWASASWSSGFGTPTDKNSANYADAGNRNLISVDPVLFSPDNDGYQDFCFVKYHLAQGFTANISIYDMNGRAVKRLANNYTLGEEGDFRWDGLDDAGNPLPIGHYVILVNLFSLQGKMGKYKLLVTLARKN
jgi:hypothetical protein